MYNYYTYFVIIYYQIELIKSNSLRAHLKID